MEHLFVKHLITLQEDFDRDGIDWNAYTSGNEIVFYLTGLDEKVSKYKKDFVKQLTTLM
jgi:predicted Zn-dependent peptidase